MKNDELVVKINETVRYLKGKCDTLPSIGMITGTGLGDITEEMNVDSRISYKDIPNFPVSTIEGHKGTLVFGQISGKNVMALEGRFHPYEGWSLDEVTFPVRVMAGLGINTLLISSAAGGLNTLFKPGDIMLVTDHINMTGKNPLVGPNLDNFGPRFPDMSEVYDRELISLAQKTAIDSQISLKEGVYVGVLGPSLETPAETRFLKMIGADAVGMSTISEAITGVHCGVKIIAIVAITNVNLPDCMQKTSIDDVISTAGKASEALSVLWEKIIGKLK